MALRLHRPARYEPDGTKIVYTVTEDQVPGYATAYDGYDVENRYTPEQTSVTVQKIWDDLDDRNGLRPEEITVRLLANGAAHRADADAERGAGLGRRVHGAARLRGRR